VADRVAATGILLVGGASERFGSPKALARFRGETLAERGWRLLHETCGEVLAVGKGDDGLDLPFPVVDDGSEERAPVYGVVAGLRAASHDVVVALPVDCPLVTDEALRRLVEARGVPQMGPLPGAYPVALLAELEARLMRGELSLRGVNENIVHLDERLLVNVNTPMELIEAAVADWARERADVRGVLVVGSRARSNTPADRWSDLDVGLFLDDPKVLAEDSSWAAEFGTPVLTFLEEAAVSDALERRVLYDGGEDVDFVLLPASSWRELAASPGARVLLSRGYRILHDELGLEAELGDVTPPEPAPLPDQAAFTELASDFWYHALWAARKLRRGEVLTALGCLDRLLLLNLVTLLGWHARSLDPSVDTWHGTRFVERWADPGALAALETAVPGYGVRDVARGLWDTIDLYQGLEEETARRLGLEVELDHPGLRRRIDEVVRDPRHASTL
jgi:molybdopterin-guanine dinucleotide biosynthesis protein A